MQKSILSAIIALSLIAVLVGCGSSGPVGGPGMEVVVNMVSMKFEPKTIEIRAGTTVRWENRDAVSHSVAEGDGENPNPLFKSYDFDTGGNWSYTFTEPGEYDVACPTASHHKLGMKMKVVVK